MIPSHWVPIHIAIAVDDLDSAKSLYSDILGVEWGPTLAAESIFPNRNEYRSRSDLPDFRVDIVGLSAVNQTTDTNPRPAPLIAPAELLFADANSPSFALWGCPTGQHYVHHIAYAVDDLKSESVRLTQAGFVREWWLERNDIPLFVYFRKGKSLRIELIQRSEPESVVLPD